MFKNSIKLPKSDPLMELFTSGKILPFTGFIKESKVKRNITGSSVIPFTQEAERELQI